MHGYGAHILIGGSTAKIGDPTGRTTDRPQLPRGQLVQNLVGIHYQLKQLSSHADAVARRFKFEKDWSWRRSIVNNTTWWNKLPMLDVLKRLGAHMRMGPMLGRDTVKKRLEDGSGMSFAEFCYPLMQAWDWWTLLQQRGVLLQIGGSDQYGNILTGAQCVKTCIETETHEVKVPNGEFDQPIGFTVPLLTDQSGNKFGKSAGNAIWLDPFRTSPYNLYGYLVRRPDDDVERLLKLFTFFPQSEISKIMQEHNKDPSKRVAQHLLAYEVSWLVHGSEVANRTQMEHRSIYGTKGPDDTVSPKLEHYQSPQGPTTVDNRPRIDMQLPRSLLTSTFPRIVFASGLATSVSDADRAISAGGIYLGASPGQYGERQQGMNTQQLSFTPTRTWDHDTNMRFLVDGKYLLLRKGKHNLRFIEFMDDKEWAKLGIEYAGQPNTGAYRKARAALLKMAQSAKEKRKEGVEDAQVDLNDLQIPESVRRGAQYRRRVEVLKRDNLIKDNDDGW